MAAIKIQRQLRQVLFNKVEYKRRLHEQRHVLVIQRAWRAYLHLILRPRQNLINRQMSILLLQRFTKGYLVNKRLSLQIAEKKIDKTAEYFKEIKTKLEQDAAYLIMYQYRRMVKRRRIEQMRLEEIKRKKAKARGSLSPRKTAQSSFSLPYQKI